jgi:hypothetical protein
MKLTKREKMAWVVTVVLVPILIYNVIGVISKISKRGVRPPSLPPSDVATAKSLLTAPGSAVPAAPSAPAVSQPAPKIELLPSLPAADAKLLAKQLQIAELLPKNNPFSPSRNSGIDPLPVEKLAPEKTEIPMKAEVNLKLTAIVSRGGASTRMAMINGRLVGEGDQISGWTVTRVNINDVLLNNGERQMTLRIK